ncbi:hypothetical protein [uncultured Proteiniphilum sp.]|uniref:HU domain-containing protein n=1 Tax=uncultured Proteiniphilum sp. TaxID=497637 RepID=UPI0026072D91|nr:hypothetical protein [uncultured Proteiniphilum sp.]
MDHFTSHIELLLHDHNCVIIPDFGGFVINTISSRKDGISTFHAPSCELVFNRDLVHNDGLLAQSYMKNGGMTFESAMQKIAQDVRELKRQLYEQRRMDMGKLGSFVMHDDKRFVYTPGSFVRPAFFGLTQATLKPLIQMQPAVAVGKNQSRQKWSRGAGISVAAVAVVAVLMFILPVSDATIGRQSARMISETGWFRPRMSQPVSSAVIEGETITDTERVGKQSTPVSGIAAPAVDVSELKVTGNLSRYYIVMGVYKGMESAQKTTQLLIDEGFHQTGWLQRPDRIDVYAASFTDKNAAEVYLREVHKKFPTHTDAWILKR